MAICPICDDTGLRNSDSAHPEFCYCAEGKQARRKWEASRVANKGRGQVNAPSFIDIGQLDEVNASVDAMRASLFGSGTSEVAPAAAKHPAIQMLYSIAHSGHEVSVVEATQLYELAKTLESFLGGLAPIGRNIKR